jgi:speckle-type POZ protein
MAAQIISPVVKRSATTKGIHTHDISVFVPDLDMKLLSGVVGEYMTQPLVEWKRKSFYMRIYRAGMDATSKGCLSLTYHVDADDYEVPLIVSFEVELEGYHTKLLYITYPIAAGIQRLSKRGEISERGFSTTPFTFSPFKNGHCAMQRTDLTVDNLASTFFLNFKVTLSIQLWQPPLDNNLSSAVNEYFSMSNESFTDVTIVTDDGAVRIPAMRFLLCARSAVFRVMLLSTGEGGCGMGESLSREITIPDFDSVVLRAMLQYIHTDMVNLSALEDHHAESLYVAANKYQIKGLLMICEEYMKATMNDSNTSRRLIIFDTLKRQEMKSFALQYFKDHAVECARSETLAEVLGVSPLIVEMIRVLTGADV